MGDEWRRLAGVRLNFQASQLSIMRWQAYVRLLALNLLLSAVSLHWQAPYLATRHRRGPGRGRTGWRHWLGPGWPANRHTSRGPRRS